MTKGKAGARRVYSYPEWIGPGEYGEPTVAELVGQLIWRAALVAIDDGMWGDRAFRNATAALQVYLDEGWAIDE